MKKIRNLILASTILITVGCSNVNSSLDINKNDVNINSSINSNSENNKYSKEKKLDKYYAYVVNNKKEGVISSDGNVVFECNYDDITLNVTDGKLYGEVTVDGKKGIINEEGDYIINPIYDDIYFGETNEFKVKLNDKFGLIDKNENVIADIIYDKISDFGYNDCAIASVNGEFGFLKNNGEFNVIDGINEISGYFKDKNTLLPAKVGTKWGFINYKGKFKIEPIFDNVSGSFISDNIVTASKDGKCGQINSTGKFINEFPYDKMIYNEEYNCFIIYKGEQTGVIDINGNIILKPYCDKIYFTNNFIVYGFKNVEYRMDGSTIDRYTYGCMDLSGNEIFDSTFYDISIYDKCIKVLYTPFGTISEEGLYSLDGNILTDEVFNSIGNFNNSIGLTYAKGFDSKYYGYINELGQYLIDKKFSNAHNFDENSGLAAVSIRNTDSIHDDDQWGYIDKTGEFVIPLKFSDANDFDKSGLAAVKLNDKWGYINTSGEFIIEPTFDNAYSFEHY